jgi:hypothetical protein
MKENKTPLLYENVQDLKVTRFHVTHQEIDLNTIRRV